MTEFVDQLMDQVYGDDLRRDANIVALQVLVGSLLMALPQGEREGVRQMVDAMNETLASETGYRRRVCAAAEATMREMIGQAFSVAASR